jgi:zinc transporter ZupT
MPMPESNVLIVFLAALVTAVATGLGALPFLFVRSMTRRVVSLSNAAAAGLMLAACHGLVAEGLELGPERLVLGLVAGLVAIVAGRRLIGDGEVEFGALKGADARKAFLIVGVMTVHSFAEGVGVGVAFAGSSDLASFITAAIAVHNIPEGLAISLVLVPRGTPVLHAALWSIFSSIPQPIAAVPAYLLVEVFKPLLPFGLGLAAGAMFWMVFSELVPDANRDASPGAVGLVATLAFTAMIAFQYVVLKG